MKHIEGGVVRPVCNKGTPKLGRLVIMAATQTDFLCLQNSLRLPDSRKLYLSTLCYNAAEPIIPTIIGPVLGAPYAVMVMETLHAWGAHTFLFMGWCGSVSSDLRNGDILLPDSALIDEGTSLHYGCGLGGVVYPNNWLYDTLRRRLRQREIGYSEGRVWSTDGIFRETPSQIKKFQKKGALAVEMEVSALCAAADFYTLLFAAVLIVSDELFSMKWCPGFREEGFKLSRDAICNLLSKIHRSLEYDKNC